MYVQNQDVAKILNRLPYRLYVEKTVTVSAPTNGSQAGAHRKILGDCKAEPAAKDRRRGQALAAKIEEIVSTGKLALLETGTKLRQREQ